VAKEAWKQDTDDEDEDGDEMVEAERCEMFVISKILETP